jgi:hypothetical protein
MSLFDAVVNLLHAGMHGSPQLFLTLLIIIIIRTQLEHEHLTPDDYGLILVATFFATPAMEVLLVLMKMCGRDRTESGSRA